MNVNGKKARKQMGGNRYDVHKAMHTHKREGKKFRHNTESNYAEKKRQHRMEE